MMPQSVGKLCEHWLREVIWRDEVGSTNQLALELANADELQFPALVVAGSQLQGRGRQGKSWFSDAGGLACTFVLSGSQLPPAQKPWSQIALITGLAVAEAIEWWIAPTRALLKWPNDVYVSGRKASGILVESTTGADAVIVVGIGVNVSTDLSMANEEVRKKAISLAEVRGLPIDRWLFLETLCQRLSEHLEEWCRDPSYYVKLYRQRCLLSGRRVEVRQAHQHLEGNCIGVSDRGGLVINDLLDQRHEIVSGEVLRW